MVRAFMPSAEEVELTVSADAAAAQYGHLRDAPEPQQAAALPRHHRLNGWTRPTTVAAR